jgi:hypothetical protein
VRSFPLFVLLSGTLVIGVVFCAGRAWAASDTLPTLRLPTPVQDDARTSPGKRKRRGSSAVQPMKKRRRHMSGNVKGEVVVEERRPTSLQGCGDNLGKCLATCPLGPRGARHRKACHEAHNKCMGDMQKAGMMLQNNKGGKQ